MIDFEEAMQASNITDKDRDIMRRVKARMLKRTLAGAPNPYPMDIGPKGLARSISGKLKTLLGKDGRTSFFTWVYGRYTDTSTNLTDNQLRDLIATSGIYKDESIMEGSQWVCMPYFYRWAEIAAKIITGQLDLFDTKAARHAAADEKMAEINTKLGN